MLELRSPRLLLSAHCCIPLQLPLAFLRQSKAKTCYQVVTNTDTVSGMANLTEGGYNENNNSSRKM